MADSSETPAVFTPGPDAEAEPYVGILEIDADGLGTGNLYTHSRRILLFENETDADRLLTALSKQDEDHSFAVRGITAAHLEAIVKIGQDNDMELWAVTKIEDDGNVVARPFEPASE